MKWTSTVMLGTILLLLLCITEASAQSHKVGQANYNCKLNKKGWFFNSEKLSCPACEAIEKKEAVAKAAEEKRRADVIDAKIAADKKNSIIAGQKLKQDIINRNKVTEVGLAMPKTQGAKQPSGKTNVAEKKDIVSIKNYSGKLYPVNKFGNQQWGVLLNDKKDTVLKSQNFIVLEPDDGRYSIDELPDNIAIVQYDNSVGSFYPGATFHPMNLINARGEKLLNSDNINWIQYCNNGLFLICSGGAISSFNQENSGTSISLYDHLTKKTVLLENVTSEITYSPINKFGVDMTNYYAVSNNSKKKNGEIYQERQRHAADKAVHDRNEWILMVYQSVAYMVGTPKYKIYYMEKDRVLKTLGVF